MPASFLSQNSLSNAGSVALSWVTAYCLGSNWEIASGSFRYVSVTSTPSPPRWHFSSLDATPGGAFSFPPRGAAPLSWTTDPRPDLPGRNGQQAGHPYGLGEAVDVERTLV